MADADPAIPGTPPAARKRADLVAVTLGVLFVSLVWLRLAAPDVSLLVYPDSVEQTYPWWVFSTTQILKFESPLWDPFSQGGRSRAGEGQEGIFYPPLWLFAWTVSRVVPAGAAIHLFAFLHGLVAFLGGYLLARSVRHKPPASLLAGFVYTLGGFFSCRSFAQLNIYSASAWIPFALAGLFLHARTARLRWALAGGACLGLSVLAGHVQPAFHGGVMLVLAAVALALVRNDGANDAGSREGWGWTRPAAGLAATAATAVLVALPQLVASMEYLPRALRWVGTADPLLATEKIPYSTVAANITLLPGDLASSFLGGMPPVDDSALYVGSIVLALLIAGALASRGGLWLLYTVLGVLLALGDRTPLFRLFYELVPLSDKVRQPIRYLFLAHVGAGLLAASGFEYLRRGPRRRSLLVAAVSACLTAGAIWIVQAHTGREGWAGPALAAAAPAVLGVCCLVLTRSRPALRCGVALVVIGWAGMQMALGWYAQLPRVSESTPAAEAVYGRPPAVGIRDFLRRRSGFHRVDIAAEEVPRSFGMFARALTPGGYAATAPAAVHRLRTEAGWLPPSAGADLLGVRYVFATRDLPDLPMIGRTGPLRIYENAGAMPLAWLVGHLEPADDDTVLGAISSRAVDLRLKSFVSPRSAGRAGGLEPGGSGAAVIRALEPSRVVIATSADRAAFLVTSFPVYPGWSVRVDGRAASLLRVNYMFAGVAVPLGSHEVELRYRPWPILLAALVAAAAMACVISALLWKQGTAPWFTSILRK